jgi:hypothetical protein
MEQINAISQKGGKMAEKRILNFDLSEFKYDG